MAEQAKAVAVVEPDDITVVGPKGERVKLTVALIKQYVAKGAPDIEALKFLNLCVMQGLNPFLGDAYLVGYKRKYGDKVYEEWQQITSKDAFLKRAEDVPEYDGFEAGIVVRQRPSSGELEYRDGMYYDESIEELVAGWCQVYRKDRSHLPRVVVPLRGYRKVKADGSPMALWGDKDSTMIRKTAIVQAHREAFPKPLGKLYTAEEFGLSEADLVKQANDGNIEVEVHEPVSPDEEVDMSAFEDDRKAYREWTDLPTQEHPKQYEMVRKASCARFYAVMHDLDMDHDKAHAWAKESLGVEFDSLNEVVMDPDMRRDLNIATYEKFGVVLFG